MSKNKIMIVLLLMLSIGIVSLYTTYAYEENNYNNIINDDLTTSQSIKQPVKDNTKNEIIISANEEKLVDINIGNPNEGNAKYGIYYKMINPEKLPDNVIITLANESLDPLEGIIKTGESKSISIKITNNSEYTINLKIGAQLGYENDDIENLPHWDESGFIKIEKR